MLPERKETRVAGNEWHVYMWPAAYKQSLFALYRIRSGIQYTSLQSTIQKPHGLAELMERTVRLLYVKGLKRIDAVKKHLQKEAYPERVNETINLLLVAGIISIHEKNERPAKGDYWRPVELHIDERACLEVQNMFPNKEQARDRKKNLFEEIASIRESWLPVASPVARRLEEIIEQEFDKQEKENEVKVYPYIQHRSIFLTIAYARQFLGKGESVPLRTLSSLVWDNTKILERYKKKVESVVGLPLHECGIETSPEILYAYGDANYQFAEYPAVSLLIGRPPMLSKETVQLSRFSGGPHLKAVLIIENLSVFLYVLKKTYYQRKDVLVLWCKGYWQDIHRRVLRHLLYSCQLPVYIWTDFDGDGLEINRQIGQWIERRGGKAIPIMLGETEFELVASNRKATDRDLSLVKKTYLQTAFPEATSILASNKRTYEHERLLIYYEHVMKQLP